MIGGSVAVASTFCLGAVVPPLAMLDWHAVFFMLFAAAACGCALAVVLADNVVRMAFYLVLSLGATAGLFFLAGAEFVGAMQLMIYVGGTLVLLVFGVMLTAQAPFVSIKTTPGDRALATIVAPLSIDAGEITDKGYVNQRAVLTHRADQVTRLHEVPGDPQHIGI